MNSMMAVLIGLLFSSGLYMMMRRSIVKVIIGVVMMSHAVNMLIFTAAEIGRASCRERV